MKNSSFYSLQTRGIIVLLENDFIYFYHSITYLTANVELSRQRGQAISRRKTFRLEKRATFLITYLHSFTLSTYTFLHARLVPPFLSHTHCFPSLALLEKHHHHSSFSHKHCCRSLSRNKALAQTQHEISAWGSTCSPISRLLGFPFRFTHFP